MEEQLLATSYQRFYFIYPEEDMLVIAYKDLELIDRVHEKKLGQGLS